MPASDDPVSPLPPDRLYRAADIAALDFETTQELAPLREFADQPRAHEAIRFGTDMAVRGFNIFAIGANGARIQGSVRALLEDAASASARSHPTGSMSTTSPRRIGRWRSRCRLAGRRRWTRRWTDLIDDLKVSLPAAFESEDYQKRRGAIEQEIRGRNERAFTALRDKATAKGIAILRTPMGFAMAPMKDGQVVPPAEFNAWPAERQQEVQTAIEELEKDLEDDAARRCRGWSANSATRCARWIARPPASPSRSRSRSARRSSPTCRRWCSTSMRSRPTSWRTSHCSSRRRRQARRAPRGSAACSIATRSTCWSRTADGEAGAPVIEEVHPTLSNLVGRIEHLAVQGALVTNFRLIKPGSLHRANGGALMIDLRNLLAEPLSWAALKRALLRQEIVIEDAARFMGMTATVTLEPDPIPLDVKVVLFGDRMLYYMLVAADPDTAQHFKVLADFDDDVDRSPASEAMIARLIGSIAANAGLVAARSWRRGAGDRARGAAGRRRRQAHAAGREHPRPGGRGIALRRAGRTRRGDARLTSSRRSRSSAVAPRASRSAAAR